MEDNSTKLLESLYSNPRMSMDFFMRLPDGIYTNKDRDGIRFNHYPQISIICKKNNDNGDFYDFAKAIFHVTVNNHYQVIKFFNKTMKWLFDDAYNDLFLMGPTNKLMFNSDYKSLHAEVQYYTQERTQIMKAIPSLVSYDGKSYEGINLFINTSDYMIPLTYNEVGIIFSILSEFNFSAEVTKLLTMYDYVIRNNRVRPSISETKTPFD